MLCILAVVYRVLRKDERGAAKADLGVVRPNMQFDQHITQS
jgi:hypothetical protein